MTLQFAPSDARGHISAPAAKLARASSFLPLARHVHPLELRLRRRPPEAHCDRLAHHQPRRLAHQNERDHLSVEPLECSVQRDYLACQGILRNLKVAIKSRTRLLPQSPRVFPASPAPPCLVVRASSSALRLVRVLRSRPPSRGIALCRHPRREACQT